jgi:transposase
VNLREIRNAIRYARTGSGWRMLPHEFGAWQTVYWWCRRFVRRLLFQPLHDVALMLDREQAGREASPTAGAIDSQTVKGPSALGGGGRSGEFYFGASGDDSIGIDRRAASGT